MESAHSASDEPKLDTPSTLNENDIYQSFTDRFETLLPKIQERWPDLAKQTLEATRGSLDELVRVISTHSGKNTYGVKEQLEELFNSASDRTKDIAESLEPLEKQLEDLLDDLNSSLRPRIEKPIRQKPLLSIGIAAGVGILLGIIFAGGRRA
tara:strand:- start:132 stop:590 length:459 start_codon:yes stop_codon:yes gene_type:complete